MSVPVPPIDAPMVKTGYVGTITPAWEGFFTELYYTLRGGVRIKGNEFKNTQGESNIRLVAEDLQFNGLSLPTPTEDGQILFRNATGDLEWRDSDILDADPQTGDVEYTIASSAPDGWILMDDGTIGDASSGATTRANADTEELFKKLWDLCDNTICPVSGGRGASSAADFSAHKTLQLPLTSGRVVASAGSGSGLTARTAGETTGNDTITLQESDVPAHVHDLYHSVSGTEPQTGVLESASFSYGTQADINVYLTDVEVISERTDVFPLESFSIEQPSVELNMLIKL